MAVRSSKGFTLAELLVVMAIIAILAAILFPVLRQAQDTARMRVCTANLKELGQAMRLYLDDHNGYATPAPIPVDWYMRPGPLMTYLKQSPVGSDDANPRRLWICPGDRGFGNEPPRWRYNGEALSSYLYPYGAYLSSHDHVDVISGTTGVNTPRRPDQWAKQTRNVLFCDWSANFHRGQKVVTPGAPADDTVRCVNFVMVDGHVVTGTRWDRMEGFLKYTLFYDNPYSLFYDPTRNLRLTSAVQ